jgi:hypothetical protein
MAKKKVVAVKKEGVAPVGAAAPATPSGGGVNTGTGYNYYDQQGQKKKKQ